jgi:hypothetical protein
MIKTILTSSNQYVSIHLPESLTGKQIETIVFILDKKIDYLQIEDKT